MKRTKKGFTLIELIIVIAILGILAAILVVSLGPVLKEQKVNVDKSSAIGYAKTVSTVYVAEQLDLDSDLTLVKAEAVADKLDNADNGYFASVPCNVIAAADSEITFPAVTFVAFDDPYATLYFDEVAPAVPAVGEVGNPGYVAEIPATYELVGIIYGGQNGNLFSLTFVGGEWVAAQIA